MWKDKTILITGGAGFIGSSLAHRLVNEGARVVLFDNLHRNAVKRTDLLSHPSIELIEGDVMDKEALSKAMEGLTW